ncbi:hypothetical protein Bca4012_063129 [Brassica carinata]
MSFNFVVAVCIILANKLVMGRVGFNFPIFPMKVETGAMINESHDKEMKESYFNLSAEVSGGRKYENMMSTWELMSLDVALLVVNTALDLLKRNNVSAAFLAPEWVYETAKRSQDALDFQGSSLLVSGSREDFSEISLCRLGSLDDFSSLTHQRILPIFTSFR